MLSPEGRLEFVAAALPGQRPDRPALRDFTRQEAARRPETAAIRIAAIVTHHAVPAHPRSSLAMTTGVGRAPRFRQHMGITARQLSDHQAGARMPGRLPKIASHAIDPDPPGHADGGAKTSTSLPCADTRALGRLHADY